MSVISCSAEGIEFEWPDRMRKMIMPHLTGSEWERLKSEFAAQIGKSQWDCDVENHRWTSIEREPWELILNTMHSALRRQDPEASMEDLLDLEIMAIERIWQILVHCAMAQYEAGGIPN
jgi:hypothetical protein